MLLDVARALKIFSIDLSKSEQMIEWPCLVQFQFLAIICILNGMSRLIILAVISCVATAVVADYNGPFMLWGPDSLKDIDISALSSLNEKTLRNLYSESSAIVLFVRNSTDRLSLDNYPTFASVVSQGPSKYLTQYWLPVDPVDYNVNTEVMCISIELLNVSILD